MKDEIQARRAAMTGKDLYKHRCEVCHGEQGMGDDTGAELIYPKPRDFRFGLFKYKTSPGTLLPRDEDLFNTIKSDCLEPAYPAGLHCCRISRSEVCYL